MTPNDEVEELRKDVYRIHEHDENDVTQCIDCEHFIRELIRLGYSKQSPSSGLVELNKDEVMKWLRILAPIRIYAEGIEEFADALLKTFGTNSSGLRNLDMNELEGLIRECQDCWEHHQDGSNLRGEKWESKLFSMVFNDFPRILGYIDNIDFCNNPKQYSKFGTKQEMPTEEEIVDVVSPWCKDFRYDIAKAILALIERKGK